MNYAAIKTYDIANGPGVRSVVFVSGCTHHCKECFQPETWDFDFGQPFTQEVIDHILDTMAPPQIAGLTVLGGEPFEPQNQEAVLDLLEQVRAKYPNKSIWAFSGFLFDQLIAGKVGNGETVRKMLELVDVLVDGPFVLALKDLTLRFRGSSNQRLIDMPKTLAAGEVILWDDGYNRGGMQCRK